MYNGHFVTSQYPIPIPGVDYAGPIPVSISAPAPAATTAIEVEGAAGSNDANVNTVKKDPSTQRVQSAPVKFDDPDPEVNRLLAKYDINNDGHYSTQEVKAIIQDFRDSRQTSAFLKKALMAVLCVLAFLLVTQSLLVWWIVEATKEVKVSSGAIVDSDGKALSTKSSDFSVSDGGILTGPTSETTRRADTSLDMLGKPLDSDHLGAGASTAIGVRTAYQQRRLVSTMPFKYFKELLWLELESPSGSSMSLKIFGISRIPTKGAKCGSVLLIDTHAGTITLDDADMSFKDEMGDLFDRAGFKTQILPPTVLDKELELFLNGTQRRSFRESERVSAVAFFNIIDDADWLCESVKKPEPPTIFSAVAKLYESCMKEEKNFCVYRGKSATESIPQYGLVEDNNMLFSVTDLQIFNNATDYFRVSSPKYHPGVAMVDHFHRDAVTRVRRKRTWQVHGNKTVAQCQQQDLSEHDKDPQALPDDYIFHYVEEVDGMRRFRISYQIEYQGEKIALPDGTTWFHIDYFDDNVTLIPRVIIDAEGSLTRFDSVKREEDMVRYEDLGLPSFSDEDWENCVSLTNLAMDQGMWNNVTKQITKDPQSDMAAKWNATGWDFSQSYPFFATGPDSVTQDMLLYYLASDDLPADEEDDYREWAKYAMAITSSGFISPVVFESSESERRSLEESQMRHPFQFKRYYEPVPRRIFPLFQNGTGLQEMEAAIQSLRAGVGVKQEKEASSPESVAQDGDAQGRRSIRADHPLSDYKTIVKDMDGNLQRVQHSRGSNLPQSQDSHLLHGLRRRAKARTKPNKEGSTPKTQSIPMCFVMPSSKFCFSQGRIEEDWQVKVEAEAGRVGGEFVFKRPGLYSVPSKQCKIVASGAIEVAFYEVIKLKGEVKGEKEAFGPQGDLHCDASDRPSGVSGLLKVYADMSLGLADVVRFLPHPFNTGVQRAIDRLQVEIGSMSYENKDMEFWTNGKTVYSNNVHKFTANIYIPVHPAPHILRFMAQGEILVFEEPIGDVETGEMYRDDSHASVELGVGFQGYSFWKDLCFWCSSKGKWENIWDYTLPKFSISGARGFEDNWGVCRQPCREAGKGTCSGDENSPCTLNMDGSLPTTPSLHCPIACEDRGDCPGFALDVNTDYAGGDLGLVYGLTTVECMDLCLARSDCAGFVTGVDGFTTECLLKARAAFYHRSGSYHDIRYTYRRLLCDLEDAWYCPDFAGSHTTNYYGADLANGISAASTIQDCRSKCDDRSDCFGFVWISHTVTCYLKGGMYSWAVKWHSAYSGYYTFWMPSWSKRCIPRKFGALLNGCPQPRKCANPCGFRGECKGYDLTQDWNIWGHDIANGQFWGIGTVACSAKCNDNPECAGFVMSSEGQDCWLKTIDADFSELGGYTYWGLMTYKKRQCSNAGPCEGYEHQENTNVAGGDMYAWATSGSAGDCSIMCDELTNCAGFVHSPPATCYLKMEAAFQAPGWTNMGLHTYIRKCPHNCIAFESEGAW
eukprot:CAMPEP_0181293662 /NCGR_PEP_ID=MMETSP1101-20121128/3183_1 /TAXON_ID=46948 /ORGANISM="Rhodomonas abbreviata, Strain Caron Lab Isolate" /LENGTH=1489 /DNA_ID=CAMNT_0023398261 /DNA_START=37 /DNA_END=4503 /DNA_ORIENTATION=+